MAEITLRKGLEVCYTQCQREHNEKRLSFGQPFRLVLPLGLGRLCALWVFVYNPLSPLKGGKLGSSHRTYER